MQRIACITQRPRLLPSFSAGIRHNSTEVPTKAVKRTVRVPLARLGDVVIREWFEFPGYLLSDLL